MKAPKRRPMTDKALREMLARISAVQTNRVQADETHSQLITVALTLRMVRGDSDAIAKLLQRAENEVRAAHANWPNPNCCCRVCCGPLPKP